MSLPRSWSFGARARALALFTLLSCAGCGKADEDDDGTTAAGPIAPIPFPGCEAEAYEGCDVLDPACQQAVFDLVRCVRSSPAGVLVPIRTLTKAAFAAELAAEPPPEPDDAADTAIRVAAFELLRLATPGQLDPASQREVLVDTVAAYYSSETKEITLLIPDRPLSEGERARRRLTLAHEFVHALQDQEHGLEALHSATDTFDSALALDAAIEGEAVLYQTFIQAAAWGLAQDEVDFLARFERRAELSTESLASESPLVWVWRVFPYTYGARYAWFTWRAGGPSAVAALLPAPPGGSHPYLVSESGIVADPLLPVDDPPPPAPQTSVGTYTFHHSDVLGAFLLGEFAQRVNANAAQLVRSWRGDRMYTYRAGVVAVIWHLRLATDADAAALASAVSQAFAPPPEYRPGTFGVFASGPEVFIAVQEGYAFDAQEWLTAVVASQPAPLP